MNKKGLLLVMGTAFISGFSIFMNKFAVSIANPYIFTFSKNVTVALILIGAILFWKSSLSFSKLSRRQWISLVIIGIMGGSVPFLLFFKGLSMTSAVQGAFIHKFMFVFSSILAVIFLREKINKYFVSGAALLLLGNLIAVQNLRITLGAGDLLVFLAVLFWSAENIISKIALRDLDGKTVAWGRMFFGSIFILIFLFASGQSSEILSLSMKQFGWVAITSVFLFFYVLTWYNGLKLVSVSVATSVLVLGSVITTVLSSIYSGRISETDLYSGLAVIFGTMIIIGSDYILEKQKLGKNIHGWS